MSILHEVEAATPHPSNTALADKESKGQWWRFGLIAVISVIMIIFVMIASVIYVRSTRQEIRG